MAVFFCFCFLCLLLSNAGLVYDEDAKKQKKLNFMCRVACIYIRYHVTLKIAQIFSLRFFFSHTMCCWYRIQRRVLFSWFFLSTRRTGRGSCRCRCRMFGDLSLLCCHPSETVVEGFLLSLSLEFWFYLLGQKEQISHSKLQKLNRIGIRIGIKCWAIIQGNTWNT